MKLSKITINISFYKIIQNANLIIIIASNNKTQFNNLYYNNYKNRWQLLNI
jgi:hypothetical protein